MPLAIELAAAWSTVLTPAEIAAEIKESLDFLGSDAGNRPRAPSQYACGHRIVLASPG